MLAKYEVSLIADVLDARGLTERVLAPVLRAIGGAPRAFAGPAKTITFRVLEPDRRFPQTKIEDLILGLERREAYLGSGDVVVIGFEGAPPPVGIMGGALATFYSRRGIAGVVTDGFVRDAVELGALGLPVFAAGTCPTNARGRVAAAPLGQPVCVAGISIAEGDFVAGDADGVVIVPREVAADPAFHEQLSRADERDRAMGALLRDGVLLSEAVRRFGPP